MTTADASGTQQTGTQQQSTGGTQGATTTEVAYKFDPIDGIQLAPEFDADIVTVAKAMGWDQATAAKFRAFEAKSAHEAMLADKKHAEESAAQAKLAKEQADTQRKQAWEQANRNDTDFGGQKYHETTQRIEQLIAMTGERGKALMKEMGEAAPELLNHPAFRGFLAAIAYKMADGKFHEAANGHQSSEPKSFADVAYGNKYPAAAR